MDTRPLPDRPLLVTARLVLRHPQHRDTDAIVAAIGDRDVARRLARVPHPYGPEDAAFFLDRIVPHEWVWAITRKHDDTLIGAIGLTPSPTPDVAELGYWLGRPHWGSGLATEAARAVIAFGVDTLALRTITSGYFLSNPASGRVPEKLGFIETGPAMRPCLVEGGDVPSMEVRLSSH